MMPWRMATLNLEQNHKRWDVRRELVIDQLAVLQPDVVALNEICLPLQRPGGGSSAQPVNA
jgi:hypothetical protein